jgi:hypothetical protein
MRRSLRFFLAALVLTAGLGGLAASRWLPGLSGSPPSDREVLEQWVHGALIPSPFPSSPHREDSEDHAALSACRALLDTPAAPELRARYAAALSSKPTERRALAVGCLQDTSQVEALIRLVSHRDPAVSAGAVRALGFFGEGARLEHFLTYGGRFAAVEFPASPDARATQTLVDTFTTGAPELRRKALNALQAHRGAEVLAVANAAAAEPELAVEAASLLGALACGEACVPGLESILSRPSIAQGMAARALAETHQPRAARALLSALDGSDKYLRENVARDLWVFAGIAFPWDGSSWSVDPTQLRAAWSARLLGQSPPPELLKAARDALALGEKASEDKRCADARAALLRAAALGAIFDQPALAGAAAHGLGKLSDRCDGMFYDEEWFRFALGERRKAKDAAGIRDSAGALGATLFTRRAVPEAEAASAEAIAAAESLKDFTSAARFHAMMAVLWSKASENEVHCAPRCGALTPRLDSDEERMAREHFTKVGELIARVSPEQTACAVTRLAPERCAQLERKP